MKYQILLLPIIIMFFAACSVKPLEPVQYQLNKEEISFVNQIKPILDNRCVSCHSCYNSPCQLKLSSYEGLKRGASKEDIYANRLSASDPTRLFVDAINEKQWREKDFYSVTQDLENSNESIMMQYLFQKMENPEIIGKYSPEKDELSCVQDKDELEEYFEDNPHKGMPYGFPALKKEEYNLLMTWLKQGAKSDIEKIKTPTKEDFLISKFESFFNNKNIKYKVSARYIYEHLFLAHISFDDNSENFYELVRSRTPRGQKVEVIPTRFPYDEIKEPFYYRFQKIKSTIVHKTHMVYKMNGKRLQRYKDLFIKPKWDIQPYLATYDKNVVANALKVFEQIPAKTRYEFLLDDIHYIIMTFIRGPVCKGQIALNVIQDHFWVMFLDPKYDASLFDRYFLHDNIENLSVPNQLGDNPNILKTFKILDNYDLAKQYNKNKSDVYKKYYPNGLPLKALWKGNSFDKTKNDSMLTIYRHFDSASVHKGALGDIPKTLWLIDYPLLERIYYSLVAGFDVFGNTPHQLLVRKHMDRLRIEGESNFLEFLPKNSRKEYFNSWYQGWLASYLSVYNPSELKSNISYSSSNYKEEFVYKAFDYLKIKKDPINFLGKNYKQSEIKKEYKTKKEIEETLKTLTLANSSEFVRQFTDSESNLGYLRIKMNNKQDLVYTVLVNRWHKNVALLFDEESRLDSSKDRFNFIEGFVGSYPNVFIEVKQDDLSDFFDLLKNYQDTPNHLQRILKYSINRANKDFWEKYDWFDKEFKKQDKLNYGIFDLNRYISDAIN